MANVDTTLAFQDRRDAPACRSQHVPLQQLCVRRCSREAAHQARTLVVVERTRQGRG